MRPDYRCTSHLKLSWLDQNLIGFDRFLELKPIDIVDLLASGIFGWIEHFDFHLRPGGQGEKGED